MESEPGDKRDTPAVSEGADDHAQSKRIDVYLSGGGYRAALGALGVMYFLAFEGRWQEVRRVVSVSGGSVVNAHLALARPDTADVPEELTRLFRTLTSRRQSLRALGPALAAVLVVPVVAAVVTFWVLSDSVSVLALVGLTLLVALLVLPIGLFYAVRLWLWLLYRSIVGTARLDDLVDSDWMVEHVLVATDLSGHGSVFFVVNAIQPQVASVTRGYFDGRDVPFRKALRATTALPPILPPTRLTLTRRDTPLAEREYLWDPETAWDAETGYPPPESVGAVTMWLADGGVTGNLGIQLDSRMAPDNLALLEHSMSKTMRGAVRTKYMCRWHNDQISWNCCACNQETVVVDASGTTRPAPSILARTLGIPLLGLPYFTVRSLQVMYGSSLSDDQGLAGDQLVGVVSTDQMLTRIAAKNAPLSRSESSTERMVQAGAFFAYRRGFTLPSVRRTRMPALMQACYAARMESSNLKTGLSAVSAPVAARVVASGYLNACLNAHGPGAIETADQGIRQLAELLGPDSALDAWWEGVLADMSAADPATPRGP